MKCEACGQPYAAHAFRRKRCPGCFASWRGAAKQLALAPVTVLRDLAEALTLLSNSAAALANTLNRAGK